MGTLLLLKTAWIPGTSDDWMSESLGSRAKCSRRKILDEGNKMNILEDQSTIDIIRCLPSELVWSWVLRNAHFIHGKIEEFVSFAILWFDNSIIWSFWPWNSFLGLIFLDSKNYYEATHFGKELLWMKHSLTLLVKMKLAEFPNVHSFTFEISHTFLFPSLNDSSTELPHCCHFPFISPFI